MSFEVFYYAGVVVLACEPGVDEDSYGSELAVAWVSASFRFCWDECFVDDKPDEFAGFHG